MRTNAPSLTSNGHANRSQANHSQAISRQQPKKIFLSVAVLTLVTLFSVLWVNTARAQGYQPISPAMNTSTPDQVEVIEFFWLGCPHCFRFEPDIEDWVANKPDNVVFVREAPALNDSWEQHSRSFYAAQIMGIEDEFVKAMFEAIHGRKTQNAQTL